MGKKKNIKRINKIIKEWGGFSIADVEADSSPLVNSCGKTIQLAEIFYDGYCVVTTYVNDTETNTDDMFYTDLRKDTIADILILVEEYDAQQIKLHNSIKDEDI
jgi:hypothetical protein